MSRIKGRDTKPEILLKKALWAEGLRHWLQYRVNGRSVAGRPDLVFPGGRMVVFVDGCFWHGCPEHATKRKGDEEFWGQKLKRNIDRHKEVTETLCQRGWSVLRIWEHEIKNDLSQTVDKVMLALRGGGYNRSSRGVRDDNKKNAFRP